MNRTSTVVTIILLAAVAGVGWCNHRRLAALRAEHDDLVGRAAAAGHAIAAPQLGATRETRRPRRDPEDEARRFAAEQIARARAETGSAAPETGDRSRAIEAAEALASMDSHQLRLYIREVLAAVDLDRRVRARLADSALHCLLDDHPQDALELILGSEEVLDLVKASYHGPARNTVFHAVCRLAELDPDDAIAWLAGRRELIPRDYRDVTVAAVALAAGRTHAGEIASLGRSFGCGPMDVAKVLHRDAGPAEERLAVLAVLAAWRNAGGADAPMIPDGWAVSELVFGGGFNPLVEDDAFAFSTRWIEGAGLSAAELEQLTVNLSHKIALADTGRWVGWLDRNLPPETARERIDGLVAEWTRRDVRAAADWLAGLPDGPLRSAVVATHAVTLLPHEPDTAVERALGLPEGQPRTEALRRLHRAWPLETDADRAAAAAFAAEHGID